MKTTFLLALAVACAACSPADRQGDGTEKLAAQPAQCMKDTDCKGDRICEKGICTAPPTDATMGFLPQQEQEPLTQDQTASASPPAPTSTPEASATLLEESLGFERSDDDYLGKLDKVIAQLIRNGAIPKTPALVFDDKTTFYVPLQDIEVFGSKLVAIEHRYNMEYLGGPPVYGVSVLLDVKKDQYIVEGVARTYKCEVTPLKDGLSDMGTFVDLKLPKLSLNSLIELSCTTRV